MRVKFIKDKMLFRNISVVYKNKEYTFDGNDYVFVDIDDDDRRVFIKNMTKSSVFVNIIDLMFHMLAGDGTITTACCSYAFDIVGNDNCEITIAENKYSTKYEIYFESICALSQTAELKNDTFIPNDLDRLNKKHRRIHALFMSGIPLYTVLALLLVILEPDQIILPAIIVFLIFTIPSLVKRRRYKKLVTADTISRFLLENTLALRADGNPSEKQQTNMDRIISNIVKKMFKSKEKS